MADITSDFPSGGGGGGSGGDMASVEDVPLLVRVLAGNPVTGAAILTCLHTVDASRLRRLHAAVAGAVARVPWADMDRIVADVVRWRAAFPAAVGVRLSHEPAGGHMVPETRDLADLWDVSCKRPPPRLKPSALAALAGVTRLELFRCIFVTDELLLRLPASLRILNVCECKNLTDRASFTHLTALTTLYCRETSVGGRGVRLPASLQVLHIDVLRARSSLAGLTRLRELYVSCSLDNAALASLPPSLQELGAAFSPALDSGASFAHLTALHTLNVSRTGIDDASLASMPPSLVNLWVERCCRLSPTATLPPLPLLRRLDISHTGVGDALVASLPAGLTWLRAIECYSVAGATFDHVPALQTLWRFRDR